MAAGKQLTSRWIGTVPVISRVDATDPPEIRLICRSWGAGQSCQCRNSTIRWCWSAHIRGQPVSHWPMICQCGRGLAEHVFA